MRIGPERVCEFLESVGERLHFLNERGRLFLLENERRVESFRNSAYVVSVSHSGFPVVFAVSPEGGEIVAETISDPFETTPSPYRLNPSLEEVRSALNGLLNPASVRGGIFEFPPKTRFLAVVGDDQWISKISFREKIKGVMRLSFATLVGEELYERLSNLNGRVVEEMVYMYMNDDELIFVVLVPEDFPERHVSLLAEMSKTVREGMGLKPSNLSKVPVARRVLTTLKVDLEDVIKERLDVESIAREFVGRLKKGYESFLKGADLS